MTNDKKQIPHDPQQMPLWSHESDAQAPPSRPGTRSGAMTEGLSGPTPEECLWDITAVSIFLGVPVASIYQWRVKGEGPPATRMGKHLRYEPALVRAWVSEHRESA